MNHTCFHFGRRGLRGATPGNQETVPTGVHLGELSPDSFTQHTFGPISGDSLPHPPTSGKSKSAGAPFISLHYHDNEGMPQAPTRLLQPI